MQGDTCIGILIFSTFLWLLAARGAAPEASAVSEHRGIIQTYGRVPLSLPIRGSSFTGAMRVFFGSLAAASFAVNSDTQITATVPSGAKTGKIVVTTPGGIATSTGIFTITP